MPTPATPKQFRDSLEQLIDSAAANDVDIEGTWFVCDDDAVKWTVDISPGPNNRSS